MDINVKSPGNVTSDGQYDDLNQTIQSLEALPRVLPANPERIDCLARLSSILLNSDFTLQHKHLRVLGYWLRRASLKRLSIQFENEHHIYVPQGLVLHFPPENVDTLFVYSWALSYLCGNANICRLPGKTTDVGDWLLSRINEVLEESTDSVNQIFRHYPKDENTIKTLSSYADVRVIWGGDEKIRHICRFPTRVDGLTIPFSSRKSVSVISTAEYMNASCGDKKRLSKNLFNDAYWFDQMACGSPGVICWIGGDNNDVLRDVLKDFHSLMQAEIARQDYAMATHIDIRNYTAANVLAADNHAARANRICHGLTTVQTDVINEHSLDISPGGGFFVHAFFDDINGLLKLKTRRLQTIATFGIDRSGKALIAEKFAGVGAYRVVDIGKALSFGPVWDGIDLMSSLTRKVVLD